MKVKEGGAFMYKRRIPRGSFAVAFGLGLIVASICSSGTVIFLLAIMIIFLGLCCTKR